MREKARRGEQTFSLTADVAEALQQVPVDRRDWHLLGCQVEAGGDVYINSVGTFGVASASYYWSERPFLGPLYRFMSLHPRNSVWLDRDLPALFLRCGVGNGTESAQASEGRSGIVGWAPVKNSEGKLDPWLSPWFSYEHTRLDWPWIFERERGDKPSLIISTLEALAVHIDEPVLNKINVDQVPVQRSRDGTLLLSKNDCPQRRQSGGPRGRRTTRPIPSRMEMRAESTPREESLLT